MKKIPLIAIVGPTASGKTSLAIEIAKRINGEIVSADSMQIYKGIPIAAAVPTMAERQGIEHHLMEFVGGGEQYTVADYVNKANSVIAEIYSCGKQPILVGGTGLYVNSVIDGTEFIAADTDLSLRQKIEEEFEEKGGEQMLSELRCIDAAAAQRLHPNDKKRIVRAFEIYRLTGLTLSEQNEQSHISGSRYNSLLIGINFKNRETLYNRIEKRIDIMLENGLIEEARAAYTTNNNLGAAQAIGHKELFGYFAGEQTLSEAIDRLKAETRHYAKRQLTWFRRREDIKWIYADECEPVGAAIQIINRSKANGEI